MRPAATTRSRRAEGMALYVVRRLLQAIPLLVGISFAGFVSAVRRGSVFDYAATTAAMVGLSVPTFWFGLVVVIVFAGGLRWIPSGGIATLGAPFSLWDRFIHLIGPAAVLGLWMTATWSRYTRSSVLEVVGQDYIRTARAKGLPGRAVLLRHTLRNALIPLITLGGLEFRNLFGGALVTETVFSWPGAIRSTSTWTTNPRAPARPASCSAPTSSGATC